MSYARYHFGSLRELLDFASDARAVSPVNLDAWHSHYHGAGLDPTFYSTAAPLPEVALVLARGWPEGVATMRADIGVISAPRIHSVRRRAQWGDQGDSVDLGRMYAGQFQTAFRAARRSVWGQPPRIRIVCSTATPHTVAAADMMWRGASAATLAEALIVAGYMVEIDAVYVVEGLHARIQHVELKSSYYVDTSRAASPDEAIRLHVFVLRVKSFDAPFALGTTTAVLAHPAMVRRVMFCVTLRAAEETVRTNLGYVIPIQAVEDVRAYDIARVAPAERVIVVPPSILSAVDANVWLRECIASLESIGA